LMANRKNIIRRKIISISGVMFTEKRFW